MEEAKRVLVAVRPTDEPLVSGVLGSHFDVIVAHTLRKGTESIDDSVGLIVCGVHFDQGSTFDFLKAAKSKTKGRSVPFLLVLGEDTRYPPEVITAIQRAAMLLGADGFIDLGQLRTQMSHGEMFAGLRERVSRLLSYQH